MSRVYTDTIEPRKPTQDITLGTSGETITLPGNDLRVNTVKDKGGNTLWTSDGSGNVSSVNAGMKGNLLLLSTQTASGDASIEFTSGIDSTYKLYIFTYYNVNPAADNDEFGFQASVDGGSSYGVTCTTTFFRAVHGENGSGGALSYETGSDIANGTNNIQLITNQADDADGNCSGTIHLFSPSNTTYVKHFFTRTQGTRYDNYAQDACCAGYFNTTDNLDAIRFLCFNGNFDGTIKMYGLL